MTVGKVVPAGDADRYKPVISTGYPLDYSKETKTGLLVGTTEYRERLINPSSGLLVSDYREICIVANQTAVNDNLTAGTTQVLAKLDTMKELMDPEKLAQTAKIAAVKAETALKQIESAAEVTAASAPLMAKLEAMQATLQASEATLQASEVRQQAMEVRQQAIEAKLAKGSACVVM
jgi:hypothetical protein